MSKANRFFLLIPATLGILVFALFPLLQIAIPTVTSGANPIALYSQFLQSHYDLQVIFRTLTIAVITTLVTVLLGLPTALWISRQTTAWRQVLSVIILFPILTNAVVRNFAWIIILGKNGVLNNLLQGLHLISAPLTLLYTDSAIVIGSVYLFLPIMITTLVDSANGLNPEIEEAAAVLGSRPFTVLREIILPQMAPAILTGAILVFAGAMTAYTTPQLLGGNRHLVMSTLIYQQAMTLGNWTTASVVAIVLIGLSLLVLGLLRWYTGRLDRRVQHA
ncbi:ABC transporter permease [Schleiferilactobacillus shenzhenensis]|uniref:ABC transmembrane type-1 domain-containing protein n=1 Tax=Schleiferilactobacillus shenzhenensis LY-73 TaxID=1231336 RepID=U4TLA9_9LACO|nr:ABC transporter permease [Schleiferilactobacillus shenzhenensis]ERL64979.1 hypothetical protein L248_3141 [Schleiferilactobacillus shenzhenensis LY-73]